MVVTEIELRPGLEERIAEALRGYLDEGGEQSLHQAYELGRESLAAGAGVLDHADLLHRVVVAVATEHPDHAAQVLERSGPFVTECFSAFEMAHRAAREASTILGRLEKAREDVVRRLAHELHDEAGQMLAVVHMDLDRVAAGLPPDARNQLDPVRARLHEVELELRRISHEMRPTALDDLGLIPALRFLSEGVARRAGFTVDLEENLEQRLPPDVETVFYRAAQEALTNVTRHAHAKQVTVRIERGDDLVVLTVADDGVGFDPLRPAPTEESGLGITGMRERVASIGGTLEIRSAPGTGTVLRIRTPVPHAPHPAR